MVERGRGYPMTYADPVPTNPLFTCRLRNTLQIQRTEQNRVNSRVDRIVTLLHLHLELVEALLRFRAELVDALLHLCQNSFDRTQLNS